MEVKKVYTNKELRDTLESLNLNDDTIDLIEIDLENTKITSTVDTIATRGTSGIDDYVTTPR